MSGGKEQIRQEEQKDVPWLEQPQVKATLEKLRGIQNQSRELLLVSSNGGFTIEDIIHEIERETEKGRKFVELDAKVQERLRSAM